MRNKTLWVLVAGFAVLVPNLDAPAQMGPGRGMRGGDYWQPGWMRRHMWGRRSGPPEMRALMQRHWTFMHEGVPKPYDNAQSPLKPTTEDIGAGGSLYVQHCASCHGELLDCGIQLLEA